MSAKPFLGACVLALATALPQVAAAGHHARASAEPIQIRVSCARYALRGVIWDRPMGVFLEDLSRVGYSTERAFAIGQRVCRDERLVGNTEGMGALMRNILATEPPRR